MLWYLFQLICSKKTTNLTINFGGGEHVRPFYILYLV
jgi:hypothetical protein